MSYPAPKRYQIAQAILLILLAVIWSLIIPLLLNIFIIMIRPWMPRSGYRITYRIVRWWIHGLYQLQRIGLPQLKINITGDTPHAQACPLILSNHQSFMDIPLLFWAYPLMIPPKFILKKALLYLPIIGQSYWLLDYPFISRSKQHQTRNLDTLNQETKYQKQHATPLIIFPEGHRFHPRYQKRHQPFQYLLPPHPTGCYPLVKAFLKLKRPIYLTTVVYHTTQQPSLWKCLTGPIKQITIHLQKLDHSKLPDTHQLAHRKAFRDWLYKQWQQQDQLIDQVKKSAQT